MNARDRAWSFVSNNFGTIKYRRYQRDQFGDRPLYDDEWRDNEWIEVTVHGDPPNKRIFIRRIAHA
jgi:hypothetical protein